MFLRNLPMKKGHTFGGNCREIPRISTNPKSESFHWPKGSETLLPSVLAEATRSRNIVAVDNLWRERNAHPSNTSEASWAVQNAVHLLNPVDRFVMNWATISSYFIQLSKITRLRRHEALGICPGVRDLQSTRLALGPWDILGPRLVALVASLGFTKLLQLGWEQLKTLICAIVLTSQSFRIQVTLLTLLTLVQDFWLGEPSWWNLAPWGQAHLTNWHLAWAQKARLVSPGFFLNCRTGLGRCPA